MSEAKPTCLALLTCSGGMYIGVPIASGAVNGVDALYSIVQMPPGVPVATVGIDNTRNAAMLAAQIIALSDDEVARAIEAYREQWN